MWDYFLSNKQLETNSLIDYSLAILQSFVLPQWLGGIKPGFTPTGRIHDDLQERSAHSRAGLLRRLRHIVIDCRAYFHLLIVVSLILVALARVRAVAATHCSQGCFSTEAFTELLRVIAWPAPQWIIALFGCITPLRYCVFPPNVPERDKLLREDADGARYPLPMYRDTRNRLWDIGFAHMYSLFILYTAGVFIASWWM